MVRLFPSGIALAPTAARRDFKVYFQKSNVGNSLGVCANCTLQQFHLMDLRQ
jgi:hypothetical protein